MSTDVQIPVPVNVDITETIDNLLIEADISGFRAENIKVSSQQDSLVIEMETAQDPHQSYYLGELLPEFYRRIVPLGFTVSDKQFHTQYSSGTLLIDVKKPGTKRDADLKSEPTDTVGA